MRITRGRGGGGRSGVSIKSRLGVPGKAARHGASIQSRLGNRGALSGGSGRRGVNITTAVSLTNRPITDARQKINLNRIISGRIGDAREKIEVKRSKKIMTQLAAAKTSGLRSQGGSRGSGFSPVKTLKITTSNPSPGSSGLFRNAVSGLGGSQWDYGYGLAPHSPPKSTTSDMLTRTIRNPQASYLPPPAFTSSYGRVTSGGGMYSAPSSVVAKVAPIASREVGSSRSRRYQQDSEEDDDEDMETEDLTLPLQRSSIKSALSRLDAPSKFKVQVSNLQSSVTTDDIVELFADVGDLVSARVFASGTAEAYYRTKGDCLKAIEAYHNRLLDGSPMKVVYADDGAARSASSRPTGVIAGLKSAGGATMKIPKSSSGSSTVKIHPDISAIHKVLFQPSSSSNATKMLFNKGN